MTWLTVPEYVCRYDNGYVPFVAMTIRLVSMTFHRICNKSNAMDATWFIPVIVRCRPWFAFLFAQNIALYYICDCVDE